MTFDALRARRRWLLGPLVPLLLSSWVGAAALPCAAMGMGGDHESGHAMADEAIGAGVHEDHHRAHTSAESAPHPACPHCLHAPDGSGADDATAHAGCGDSLANVTNESRRLPDKQDLGVAILAASQRVATTRGADTFAGRHVDGIPPPTRPLYLKHCVFLN